jgi:carboxyl-terminal processing protease
MALIPRDVASSLRVAESRKPQLSDSPSDPANKDGKKVSRSDDKELSKSESKDLTAGTEGDLGMEIRMVDGRVLVFRVDPKGPATKAGVQPGWVLQAIGSDSVSDILQILPKELPAGRAQFVAWGQVKGKLAGRPGSRVKIEFLDGSDQLVTLDLERGREQGEPTTLGYLPTLYAHLESERLKTPGGGTVGLIRFNLWLVSIVQSLDKAIDEFRSADGLIIDLRGNVGGLGGMILGISGHFLGQRVSLGTLSLRGNDLSFFSNPRRVNSAGQRVEPFSGSVAILIDPLSLSAAEIFAGGMQAVGRARVFGETSGGQALPAIWDRLPNGDVLYHAVGDFVTAAGTRLETRGVIPDVEIPLRRSELLAGRDAALQAALQWIDQERAAKLRPPAQP